MTSGQPWKELLERSNRAGVQFVLIELDVTLSIIDRADLFTDPWGRRQAYRLAENSCRTASRCMAHLTFTAAEQLQISAKVREIERRLGDLQYHLEVETAE